MPILALIDRVQRKYTKQVHPVVYENQELRYSYLTGIAMQAHADGIVESQEKTLFLAIASAFDVTAEAALEILEKAREANEDTVMWIRNHLMHSKYKYYFIIDLQIMAHRDETLKPMESQIVQKFGELLEIEAEDLRFFTELADAVVEKDPAAKEQWAHAFLNKIHIHNVKPEDFTYYTGD